MPKHPERPPFWQVKAERVIQNGQKHTIRLERARFELLGKPIAYVPWIEVPDQTVKRKSGFLFPRFSTSQNLGFGLTVPYYYVFSPSMDATVTGTGYTNQGFLLDTEFRQRFENGTAYTARCRHQPAATPKASPPAQATTRPTAAE